MKYFIDTEFIEGFYKPFLGKRRHFIDLISIGIVSEDGRSYYAVSSDYNEKDADQWVKDNVIRKIFEEACDHSSGLHGFEKEFIKPTAQIADEVLAFFGCWRDQLFWRAPNGIQVFGYYADYDWVLFCSLFGRMIDLPKGFPMYCIDLKQSLDDKVSQDSNIGKLERNTQRVITFDDMLNFYKTFDNYPKQTNEHNALADAKWNRELFLFLQNL